MRQGGQLSTGPCGPQVYDSVLCDTVSVGTVWPPADSKNQVGPLLDIVIPGWVTEVKGQQNSVSGKQEALYPNSTLTERHHTPAEAHLIDMILLHHPNSEILQEVHTYGYICAIRGDSPEHGELDREPCIIPLGLARCFCGSPSIWTSLQTRDIIQGWKSSYFLMLQEMLTGSCDDSLSS